MRFFMPGLTGLALLLIRPRTVLAVRAVRLQDGRKPDMRRTENTGFQRCTLNKKSL